MRGGTVVCCIRLCGHFFLLSYRVGASVCFTIVHVMHGAIGCVSARVEIVGLLSCI